LTKEYDAVFAGIGTLKPKTLGIPGEDLKGVEHVIPFLESINCHVRKTIGKRVAVVGAGFSAMDAVRVSRRLGSEAFIVYRRTVLEMPASSDEIEEAEAEGVKMMTLCAPVRVVGDEHGHVRALECQRMELGEKDDSGRAAPHPVPGSEFLIECDMVVQAISQAVDTEASEGVELDPKWKTFKVNDKFETSVKGLFACGDCVTGPMSIVNAVGDAHRASDAIDAFLQSEKKETPSQ
ncbi:glutamate synthase beta subunit, putative, partial [Entamoeba invadens IP1]